MFLFYYFSYVNLTAREEELRVILMQNGERSGYVRLVYFSSRLMLTNEKRYTPIEQAVFSLMFIVKHFFPYLLPKRFIIMAMKE